MSTTICPNNPQALVNFLVNAIWKRVQLPIPLVGEEEAAWNTMTNAAANKQYIAAAFAAGQHPITQAVFEAAMDADRRVTH